MMVNQRSLFDPKTPLEIEQEKIRIHILRASKELKKLKLVQRLFNKPVLIHPYDLVHNDKIEYMLYRPDKGYSGDRLDQIPFNDIVSIEITDEYFERNSNYRQA